MSVSRAGLVSALFFDERIIFERISRVTPHTIHSPQRKTENFLVLLFCLSTDGRRFITTYGGLVVRKLVVP
jgi:hypothetical protein